MTRAGVEDDSLVRQTQGARPTLDQSDTKAFLEITHAPGERGLGLAAGAAGAAEAAMDRDEVEIGEGEKVHDCSNDETVHLEFEAMR